MMAAGKRLTTGQKVAIGIGVAVIGLHMIEKSVEKRIGQLFKPGPWEFVSSTRFEEFQISIYKHKSEDSRFMWRVGERVVDEHGEWFKPIGNGKAWSATDAHNKAMQFILD